jgi:hypothetical protein
LDLLRSRALPAMFDAARVHATLERLAKAPERERALWDPPLMLVLTATLLARHFGVS